MIEICLKKKLWRPVCHSQLPFWMICCDLNRICNKFDYCDVIGKLICVMVFKFFRGIFTVLQTSRMSFEFMHRQTNSVSLSPTHTHTHTHIQLTTTKLNLGEKSWNENYTNAHIIMIIINFKRCCST